MILRISGDLLVDDDFLMCPGDAYAVLDYVALHIVVTGVLCALPIELRREVEDDPSYGAEQDRLAPFIKVLVNATSYGILAEFVRHELSEPVDVVVHADRNEPFDA